MAHTSNPQVKTRGSVSPHVFDASANAIFSPTAEEIAGARQILEKAREAAAEGQGVFALGGRMVDLPIIRRAEEILASYTDVEQD